MNEIEKTFRPIILIGAARSGTNMLRDLITKLPDYGTWDCDEINPIWNYGNIDHINDVFSSEMASEDSIRFISNEFYKISKNKKVYNVVEKSCANSLKVPFISKVFPDAKYIFIHRDGRDSSASAMIEWTIRPSILYTLKKFRYVPKRDMLYYITKFGLNHVGKYFNKNKRLSFYGVRIPNLNHILENHSLEEVCALQWKYSVEFARNDLKKTVKPSNVFQIRYEDFVSNPIEEFDKLLDFLECNKVNLKLDELTNFISSRSIGKYSRLELDKRLKIENLIKTTLRDFNYSLEF